MDWPNNSATNAAASAGAGSFMTAIIAWFLTSKERRQRQQLAMQDAARVVIHDMQIDVRMTALEVKVDSLTTQTSNANSKLDRLVDRLIDAELHE